MQLVLERGSIDNPLTFDVGLIQFSFIPVCSPNACKGNPNVTIFQSNCAEGFHFSAFHYTCTLPVSKCLSLEGELLERERVKH